MQESIYSKVDNYLNHLFETEDSVLENALDNIRKNGMPEHSISANQGQFLQFMCKSCSAERIVEIGTLGGYSTIWLARGLNENGIVETIEIDPFRNKVAQQSTQISEVKDKIIHYEGEALEVLKQLETNSKKVDVFFMDADKNNNIHYFNWALKMSRKGSLIIADNVIREGKILDESNTDKIVVGVRNYLEMLSKNKRVETTILQQVGEKGHDGIAISRVL